MVSSSQPASPGRVLAVLCGAAFMASLDVFIVNVAFDSIGADFPGSSLSQLSWVLNAYAVVFAALLVPASWRWVFLVNVPVGVVALLATLRWVPESRDASITRLPDLFGAGLLAAGVGVLSLGLVKAPDWGWAAGRTDSAWILAAVCL